MNETPQSHDSHEVTPESDQQSHEVAENLDDAESPKNRELQQRFRQKFAGQMEGGKLVLPQQVNGVEWTYTLQPYENGTVAIVKQNESEVQENKEKGDFPPTPLTRMATYLRLFTDKVIGMKGLLGLLEGAQSVANFNGGEKVEYSEEKKQNGAVTLEASAMLPQFSEETRQGGMNTERMAVGGQLTAEYALGNPTSPHLAATATGQLVTESFTATRPGALMLDNSETVTVGARVGVRGILPLLGPVALYGGVDAGGRLEMVTKTTYQEGDIFPQESEKLNVLPELSGTAGARLQIGNFRTFAEVQKGSEGGARVFGGGGWTF